MEERDLIDANGELTLPDATEAIQALAREFMPRGKSKVPWAKRLQILTRILQIARNNSHSMKIAWEKARTADARVAEAERKAADLVKAAEDERDAIRNRFGDLSRHDLTIMILLAQLTLAAGCVPADLELDHPDEGPAVASGKFDGQPVVVDGTGHINVGGGRHELQATVHGADPAQGEALATYFAAMQRLGTSDVTALARQFAELMRGGAIEGLLASTGCGNCNNCAELTDRLRVATTREASIAALIWKLRNRCPAGSGTSADPVRIGIKVARS